MDGNPAGRLSTSGLDTGVLGRTDLGSNLITQGFADNFDESLASVEIYGRALNDQEVLEHMALPHPRETWPWA